MELVLNTNARIRKLVAVWNLFGPVNSPMRRMLEYDSRFLSKEIRVAHKVYKEMERLSGSKNDKDFWKAFLDRNQSSARKKYSKLVKLLGTLKVPMGKEKGAFFRKTSRSLVKDLEVYNSRISIWVKKIFGFNVPHKVDLVLDRSPLKGDRGASLLSNPSIISLQIYRYDKRIIGVLLHEILHSLIGNSANLKSKRARCGYAEEALLDYFTPYGILDRKIGLTNSLNIEKHQKEQERLRPYSAETSRALLSAIKEYYSACGETTIWSFLKKEKREF